MYTTLMYTRARLEFEVSEQPALVAKLPISRLDFLQQSLQSHKYALRLNEENTDILFNTAQILITLAEEIVENAPDGDVDASLPSSWLREALELLDACFSRQEMVFEEQAQAWEQAEAEQGGVPLSGPAQPRSSSPQSSNAGDEAVVESAVTASDLLDTARSSITAMTQLIPLESPTAIQTIRSMAEAVFSTKLPHCQSLLEADEKPAAEQETALQRATFTAAMASAEYSSGNLTSAAYLQALEPFSKLNDLSSNADAMGAYGDALVDFAASVIGSLADVSHANYAHEQGQWHTLLSTLSTALSEAQTQYTRALTLTSTPSPTRPTPSPSSSLTLSLTTPTSTLSMEESQTRAQQASLHESLGDTHLLLTRVARTGELLSLGTNHAVPADIEQAEAEYPRAAAEAYGAHARAAYREAGDERAADKVAVREGVARALAGDNAGRRLRRRDTSRGLRSGPSAWAEAWGACGVALGNLDEKLVRGTVGAMVEEELVEAAVLRSLGLLG